MGWFRNLRMKWKLTFSFGVMIGLLIALAVVSYTTLVTTQRIERDDVGVSNLMANEALLIRSNQNFIRGSMLEFIITADTAKRDAIKLEIGNISSDITSGLNKIKSYVTNHDLSGQFPMLDELEKDLTAYRVGREEEFKLIQGGKRDEALALGAGDQNQLFERIRLRLIAIDEGLQKNADKSIAESGRLFAAAVRVFIAVGIVAVLFAIFIVWLMNRLTGTPLRMITDVAEKVAAGDLAVRVGEDNRLDEVGALQRAFRIMIEKLSQFASVAERIAAGDLTVAIEGNAESDTVDVLRRAFRIMLENLREMNRELRAGFDVLATSSTEILATVSQVASGAAETATAVSETSTTAEEVKQTAHLSTQKAQAVQESAQRATVISETGRAAVADTIECMKSIHDQMETITETVVHLAEQSQAIGEINATVNDLSEQSNLLAVNAAIEATRAGEYGKGFAVVAQEVKSLAVQSRQATKQVRSILMEVQKATSAAVLATEQGSKAVAAGVTQAAATGEAIGSLMGGVVEASQAATQIAMSSQQQLVGMDQIASALSNVKQATSQNMSGAKQLEASAMNLQELGVRLKVLVERQRIEH